MMVDVDRVTLPSDPAVDLVLVALERRFSRDCLSSHLQGVGVRTGLRLAEKLMAQPLAEALATDAVGLAVPIDDDVRKRIAVRCRAVKQHRSVSQPDQNVGLFRALPVALSLQKLGQPCDVVIHGRPPVCV